MQSLFGRYQTSYQFSTSYPFSQLSTEQSCVAFKAASIIQMQTCCDGLASPALPSLPIKGIDAAITVEVSVQIAPHLTQSGCDSCQVVIVNIAIAIGVTE